MHRTKLSWLSWANTGAFISAEDGPQKKAGILSSYFLGTFLSCSLLLLGLVHFLVSFFLNMEKADTLTTQNTCSTCVYFKRLGDSDDAWGVCVWCQTHTISSVPFWVSQPQTYGSICQTQTGCPVHESDRKLIPAREMRQSSY